MGTRSLRPAQSGGGGWWSPWPGSPGDSADPGWACGKEGQGGKRRFAAPGGRSGPGTERPCLGRGGCRRHSLPSTAVGYGGEREEGTRKRKRKLKISGNGLSAAAPTGPAGRRGPGAVRDGKAWEKRESRFIPREMRS